MTGFAVVTVLHSSGDSIEACLESVPAAAEMIVVDSCSSDGGAEVVRRCRPDATLISLATNVGFGAGCNIGVRAAASEVVVLLNPDTVIERGALEILIERVKKAPSAIVGPALLAPTGELWAVCRRWSRPRYDVVELLPFAGRWVSGSLRRDIPMEAPIYEVGGAVDYLQGACLALRRDLFLDLGGFDERFFLYSEEEDLCERLWQAGGHCLYEPRAIVRHAWGTSTAKRARFATRHLYRSRTLLYRKRYGHLRGCAAALTTAGALLADVPAWAVRWILRRGSARTPGWIVAALRGLLEGVSTRA